MLCNSITTNHIPMQTFIATTRADIEQIVNNAVTAAIAAAIPGAIRKATRKPWLNTDEVMEVLNVSRRSLQHLRDTRAIEFTQRGRKVLFPAEGVEAYLNKNRIKTRI